MAKAKKKDARSPKFLESSPSNRGGYGRPPAAWLVDKKLLKAEKDGNQAMTYRDIAAATGRPQTAVKRLCRKYAHFLIVGHRPSEETYDQIAYVRPKRLRLLHQVLATEFSLKMEMRRAEDGRENSLPSAYAHFQSAARSAGFKGEGTEGKSLERDPLMITHYWASICGELGL
jgi:hypothetical protein